MTDVRLHWRSPSESSVTIDGVEMPARHVRIDVTPDRLPEVTIHLDAIDLDVDTEPADVRLEVAYTERLRYTLIEVLSMFQEHGHPGRPCLRTGWVDAAYLDTLKGRLARPEAHALEATISAADPAHAARAEDVLPPREVRP